VTSNDETPRPPATEEFAHVVAGGEAFVYPSAQAGLEVRKLSVGPYDNNVYLLSAGDEAILIDGAAEPERVVVEASPYRVTAILQTPTIPITPRRYACYTKRGRTCPCSPTNRTPRPSRSSPWTVA
jgi:hypothetical protein